MNSTLSACAYIIEELDFPVSLVRLNYVLYLCDWKSTIIYKEAITNSNWKNTSIGPYSEEIYSTIIANKDIFTFNEVEDEDVLTSRVSVLPVNVFWRNGLKKFQIDVIDFTLKKIIGLNYVEFISLINSTYPVIRSENEETLDLLKLAKKYQVSSLWDDSATRL